MVEGFRKIGKWTLRRFEVFDLGKDSAAGSGNEYRPNLGRKHQVLNPIRRPHVFSSAGLERRNPFRISSRLPMRK